MRSWVTCKLARVWIKIPTLFSMANRQHLVESVPFIALMFIYIRQTGRATSTYPHRQGRRHRAAPYTLHNRKIVLYG